MNKEQIMQIAQKANLPPCHLTHPKALERFAKLVAEHEREACAKVCENIYTGEEGCGDWPTPEMCAEAIRARGQA